VKLLKCYVENYGTLSQYGFDFSDTLTVINEENGFGKSTLCSFIMAMFYGLPQTTKRKVEENERKLRTPWQGGNFGGWLDVEIDGKQYRIERFFGVKANSDTFRLFDLGLGAESRDYTENIGVEVFGIDAEGFKRSIFFPQLESETAVNVSITAKLMNLVENSDDVSNFDKAMAVLKKRKNDYSNQRGKGFVPELESKITEAERRLNDARVAVENIAELSKRLKSAESEVEIGEARLKTVGEQLQKAAELAAAVADKKRRDELLAESEELKSEIASVDREFPCGLPEEAQLVGAFKTAEELKSLESEYKILKNDTSASQEFDGLKAIFDGRDLNASVIENMQKKAAEVSALKAKCDAKAELLKSVAAENDTAKKAPVKPIGILAAVLSIGGCAMLFVKVTVAIVLLVLGVVLFGVAAFLYLKNMIDRNAPKTDVAEQRDEYETLKREVDSINASLEAFFGNFELEGSFSEQAYRLGAMWDNYCNLKVKVSEWDAKCSELSLKIGELKAELDKTLAVFKISAQNGDYNSLFLKMRDSKQAWLRAKQSLETAEKRLEELPEVDSAVIETALDREQLKLQENELKLTVDDSRKTVLELKSRINSLLPLADSVPELENDLASFKDQLSEKESELFVIEKTMEFLESAKIGLSSRYRTPLSEGFEKYANIILGEDVGKFLLDSDFNLNIERYGKSYEKDYFSTGYKNLLDIATRFALCDALYKDVKPPVVLDDPFVNLDEQKLENALDLLKKLAEERQIIYLTCHGSRVP